MCNKISILLYNLYILDVGLLTLNQYILLDPILLCFMMCAIWGMTRVSSLYNEPFTWKWWGWLLFTGISLACTISVKFVGLFVVLLVGFNTAFELWRELGDLTKPIVSFINLVFYFIILFYKYIFNNHHHQKITILIYLFNFYR